MKKIKVLILQTCDSPQPETARIVKTETLLTNGRGYYWVDGRSVSPPQAFRWFSENGLTDKVHTELTIASMSEFQKLLKKIAGMVPTGKVISANNLMKYTEPKEISPVYPVEFEMDRKFFKRGDKSAPIWVCYVACAEEASWWFHDASDIYKGNLVRMPVVMELEAFKWKELAAEATRKRKTLDQMFWPLAKKL